MTHTHAAPGAAAGHFSDTLADAIDRAGSPVCVGFDPVVDKLPAELSRSLGSTDSDRAAGIVKFCQGVLDAAAGIAPAVKFQSACFERYGSPGVAALHECMLAARSRGFVAILDAKRGDIGISAEHYSAAAFEGASGADALTVNAYLGADTLGPYLGAARRGLFVLVRTSNPGSDGVQSQRLADGRTVAEMMGDLVAEVGATRKGDRGLSDVGAVVGATKAADAASLRRHMPDQVFLVPGYGAQGGTAESVRGMARPGKSLGEAGVLVTASRSVIYPAGKSGDWKRDIAEAARAFAADIKGVLG